jgi:glycerophosphoryl diester phosphodiesterase
MKSEADSLLIIGHRGASAHAPENTLVAFARAFEAGADGIEFDVRLARDQVPVVIHDADLRRTALKEGAIAALSSTELGKTDVGSWFNLRHPSRARAEFTRTNIPTLSQVFEIYGGGGATLYVEMKCEAREINALASEVAALINSHSLTDRVVVKSFTLDAIQEIKRLDARIRTAALFERKLTRPAPSARRIIEDALACGADQLSLQRTLVSRRILDEAPRRGLKTVVWTVDDPAWIERARRDGVHALITNDPAMMRDALLKG